MKSEYKSEVYKATQGFLSLWILLILLIFSSIFIGRWLQIPAFIGVTWIICLFISPFIFEKRIKQIFTKSVFLEFDDLSLSIKTSHLEDKKEKEQLRIEWGEIKSYKFYFSSAKNTILTIYLKEGGIKVWSFKDNKTFQEALNGESIFSIFRTFIKQYNADKDENSKIVLSKGLLNSKTGTTIIYSEAAIILTGFIFHIIMHPQSSFLTLFIGVGLVAQLFIKRKQDKDLYDKISKLDESN